MDFSASLAFLESLGAELHSGRKFDLAHMRTLLAALDHPERGLSGGRSQPPAAVHIAGTNGKGSIAAMVESVARAAGWRTGLYTSPHLQRVTERIRINGEELDAARFARLATRIREVSTTLTAGSRLPYPPSYFETLTAIGFLAMAEAEVQLAVVEVGMGGRLDATNVLAAAVAVIAPIGLDHQAYLGHTLAAIAAEKAGILKPGVATAVIAPQPPEAAAVIAARGAEAGVTLRTASPMETAPVRMRADGCPEFTWTYRGERLTLAPALPGRHQVDNAICAALACEELDRMGMAIPAGALEAGMRRVRWPGRLERLSVRTDGAATVEVWLDGAHNPMAAAALASFWDEYDRDRVRAPVIVFASLRDKAAEELAAILLLRAEAVVFTAPRQPRALAPEALAERCGAYAKRWESAPDLAAAWSAALRLAAGRCPILITGSLYLVGEAREFLLSATGGMPGRGGGAWARAGGRR